MQTWIKILGYATVFVGGLVIVIPLGTTFGAIAGYIVGQFFGQTILGVLAKMGLHDVTMWQVGACCGFFGGFLRTSVATNNREV